MSTEITQRLAKFIVETNYDNLTNNVIHCCKRSLMDYLSVSIIGSQTEVPRKVMDYFIYNEEKRICSVIGHNYKLSAPNSAFVNGCSAHALDFDDGHRRGSIHVEAVVFPAVLAMAEQYQSDPKCIISAIAIAYDIAVRISMAMHPYALERGFHNTPVAGVFGAAAGAAKILNLNLRQTINALGLAGSFSSGLYAYMQNGADVKRLHPGKAARDGIICAELAKRDVTGPPRIFEGLNGFDIPGIQIRSTVKRFR